MVQLVNGKGFVEVLYAAAHLLLGLVKLLLAVLIGVVYQCVHAPFLEQFDAGAEGDELLQARHVYAVVVGIAYLRRGTDYDNLLGMQPVEYLYDALAQGSATDDAVVYHHEVVNSRLQHLVGYVIDM